MIGIIDYQMGNLRSVQKAFEHIGAEAKFVKCEADLQNCTHLLLPGVGSFADGMAHLKEQQLIAPILDWINSDNPFLGICLGMQLLFENSTESKDGLPAKGLGVVSGNVINFREAWHQLSLAPVDLKVPHMGWNTLENTKGKLLSHLEDSVHMYFVHGYVCQPSSESYIAATTQHGHSFCAALAHDNLYAMQFHPEKSQNDGLSCLKAFAAL